VSGHALAPGHESEVFEPRKTGYDTALLGMLLFIASEVMFFAALFAAYFNVKSTMRPFPPEGTEFIDPWGLPLFVTGILILSSVTMQIATLRIRRGDRTGMNRLVAVTLALGVIFLILQLYDYYVLITHDDFTIDSSAYGTLFFTMTGFHGAHVLGGVIGLAVILARGVAGQFSARHHSAVEAVHYYWHFVDVVWVVLFLTIYVLK
jgi:cytochrome c oxidase subunit 3